MIAIDMHVRVPRNPNLPDVEVEHYLKNILRRQMFRKMQMP